MEAVEEQPVTLGSQQFIDRLNLLCHREIAKRLAREPERVLSIARSNLARWLKAHEGSNTAQALEEWQTLLDSLTVPELIKLITQDSDEGATASFIHAFHRPPVTRRTKGNIRRL